MKDHAMLDEREAFEKAMEAYQLNMSRTETQAYRYSSTRIGWAAWKNRAEIASKVSCSHLGCGARTDPIGSERSVNEYAKQDGQPRISSAENAVDAARIDWAEKQYADGLHIEKGCSGSLSGCNLKIEATVFIGNKEYRAPTIREAMDDAISAASGMPAKDVP